MQQRQSQQNVAASIASELARRGSFFGSSKGTRPSELNFSDDAINSSKYEEGVYVPIQEQIPSTPSEVSKSNDNIVSIALTSPEPSTPADLPVSNDIQDFVQKENSESSNPTVKSVDAATTLSTSASQDSNKVPSRGSITRRRSTNGEVLVNFDEFQDSNASFDFDSLESPEMVYITENVQSTRPASEVDPELQNFKKYVEIVKKIEANELITVSPQVYDGMEKKIVTLESQVDTLQSKYDDMIKMFEQLKQQQEEALKARANAVTEEALIVRPKSIPNSPEPFYENYGVENAVSRKPFNSGKSVSTPQVVEPKIHQEEAKEILPEKMIEFPAAPVETAPVDIPLPQPSTVSKPPKSNLFKIFGDLDRIEEPEQASEPTPSYPPSPEYNPESESIFTAKPPPAEIEVNDYRNNNSNNNNNSLFASNGNYASHNNMTSAELSVPQNYSNNHADLPAAPPSKAKPRRGSVLGTSALSKSGNSSHAAEAPVDYSSSYNNDLSSSYNNSNNNSQNFNGNYSQQYYPQESKYNQNDYSSSYNNNSNNDNASIMTKAALASSALGSFMEIIGQCEQSTLKTMSLVDSLNKKSDTFVYQELSNSMAQSKFSFFAF